MDLHLGVYIYVCVCVSPALSYRIYMYINTYVFVPVCLRARENIPPVVQQFAVHTYICIYLYIYIYVSPSLSIYIYGRFYQSGMAYYMETQPALPEEEVVDV